MKPKLYMETTVPSYLVSRPSRDLVVAGHQQITQEWWEKRRGNFSIFISQFVLDEARKGDSELARRRLAALSEFKLLDITGEVGALASLFLKARIIPAESATDAGHIAVAAVHGMEFLVTWNCVHIANAALEMRIQSVCRAHGFRCPVICTPEELLGE